MAIKEGIRNLELGIRGWVGLGLLVLLLGGVGGVLLDRIILPYFGLFPNAPIVINRREEIRIVEGLNQTEVAERVKNSLVTVYVHSGDPGSPRPRAIGSRPAVVVSSDGLIVAALQGLPEGNYSVLTPAGQIVPLVPVARDRLTGLSLLKAPLDSLPVIKQGFGAEVASGEKLLILWPGGDGNTVNLIVAAAESPAREAAGLTTTYESGNIAAPLRLRPTDGAPPGAAVVNKDGQLVGITLGGTTLRVEDLKLLLDNFLDDGQVIWPAWRISYQVLSPELAAAFGLPKKHGALVKSAGVALREGDFVYAVDGRELSADEGFQHELLQKKPGTAVKFQFIRAGQEREAEVQI